MSIVERLRNSPSDELATKKLLEEAAEMLEFLLSEFEIESRHINGNTYYFRSSGWPMAKARGPTPEIAIKAAMEEVKRSLRELE